MGLVLLSQHAPAESLTLEFGQDLSWPTQAGGSYQLQWQDSTGRTWIDLGEPSTGDGASASIYRTVSGSRGTYRLKETIPAAPQTQALSADGGFEAGNVDVFELWSAGGSHPPVRYSGESRSGAYSARGYLVNSGGAARESRLSQRISAPNAGIIPGESYDFSFWAKQVSSGPSYIQQYELKWLGQSGQYLSGTGLKGFSGGDPDWAQTTESNLIAPAGAASAEIVFRMVTGAIEGGHGEVLIDDVLLSSQASGDAPSEETLNYLQPEVSDSGYIRWTSRDGISYQPQTSTDLIEWSNFGSRVIGDGGQKEVFITRSGNRQFYRVEFPGGSTPAVPLGDIIPLHSSATSLNDPVQTETSDALITRLGDRARDRHAREVQFQAYDHYLTWYWEERTIDIEIIDRVAKGGTSITFNYQTQTPLSQPEFRAFFRGIGTVAEYHFNVLADLVAPNQYTATITERIPEYQPLQIGDRVEVEISQFIASPMHGRNNYYGTTFLYIIGQGIVPWKGVGPRLDSYPLPEIAWLGGETTLPYQYSNEPEHRFKQTAGNISPDTIQDFMLGRRLHHTNFQDGTHSEPGNPVFMQQTGKLGPRFINNSCVDCHVNNGRSTPPALDQDLRQAVVRVGSDAQGSPHPAFARVLQPASIQGGTEPAVQIDSYETINGQYADGTAYSLRKPAYSFSPASNAPDHYSVRMAQPLIGLGLLEAIEETTILALADPDDLDGDGISGRARQVTDPQTGQTRLGRFTHKAGQATIEHQIAAALNSDMGVATHVYPTLDGNTAASSPELTPTELEQMTKYVALLGVGARRDLDDSTALQGETLFNTIGCTDCHTPTQTTGSYHPLAELRNQTIHSFTDLLLHDMGPGLADNMGEDGAAASEWRTPPLWNIGFTAGVSGAEAYLHDGRARTLEEAILWHGGEGEAAKEAFRNLTSGQRAALIAFLRSL